MGSPAAASTYEDTRRKVAAAREARLAELVVKNSALVKALRAAHDFLDSHGNGWEEAETLDLIRTALEEHDAGYPELAQ